MRGTLSNILRWLLFLSVPASVGLVLLSQPLVTTLYQRGNFTAQDTQMVAWALVWYAVGLVGHSIVEILARSFYALHDTRTPVFVGIGAMSLNVVFSFIFSAGFNRLGWMPFGGLALANSVATALEMVVLLILMRYRLHGLQGRRIWMGLLQASAGTVTMAVGLSGWIWWSEGYPAIIRLMIGLVLSGSLYLAVLWALHTHEIRSMVAVGGQYIRGAWLKRS
jgi:putative peptidoglycan lipid II flippase